MKGARVGASVEINFDIPYPGGTKSCTNRIGRSARVCMSHSLVSKLMRWILSGQLPRWP